MGTFLLVIGFSGIIIIILLSVISVFRKSGKGKTNLLFAGISFLIIMIGGALSPGTDPTNSLAISSNKHDGSLKQKSAAEVKKNVDNSKKDSSMNTKKVEDLAIFYGSPAKVNNAGGDVSKAIKIFKQFEVIVFGDGIEHPSHYNHNSTQQVINGLKPTRNKIFGYISIGCSDKPSMSTIKQNVDEWKNMGVSGVFYDCYGFDYGVTRDKQNELVAYAHNKGLNVFANAWNPSDAMGDKNESGKAENSLLGSGDYYLLESWISEYKGELQPAEKWVKKADEAKSLSEKTGVKIAAVSTTGDPKNNNVNDINFKIASNAIVMYGFDAFQWTDDNYSASYYPGSGYYQLGLYPVPTCYGRAFTDREVIHNSDYTQMTRKTDAGQFTITQNGTTSGTAKFTAFNS